MKLKVTQINLSRSRSAQAVLEDRVQREELDTCILSEVNRKILKRRITKHETWIGDDTADSAIWIAGNHRVTIKTKSSTRGLSKVILEDDTLILSCYFSPNRPANEYTEYLETIEQEIVRHRGRVLIAGDFNAYSTLWGSDHNDARGLETEETLARHLLFVCNTGTEPTYCSGRHTSYIDITATTNPESVTGWVINDRVASSSDHMYIDFELESRISSPPSAQKKFNSRKIDATKATDFNIKECEKLTHGENIQPEAVTKILHEACLAAAPQASRHVRRKKPTYWWSAEIDEQRKKCMAARRRFTRSRRSANISRELAQSFEETYATTKKEYHKKIL